MVPCAAFHDPAEKIPHMTLPASLPAELRRWMTHQLPGLDSVVDVSWPRGPFRVWRVASDTDEVYVKLSPTPQDYAREVHAYELAGRLLRRWHDLPEPASGRARGIIVVSVAELGGGGRGESGARR